MLVIRVDERYSDIAIVLMHFVLRTLVIGLRSASGIERRLHGILRRFVNIHSGEGRDVLTPHEEG